MKRALGVSVYPILDVVPSIFDELEISYDEAN